MYMCAYTHVLVAMCALWRPEVSVNCLLLSSLYFLRQSLHPNLELTALARLSRKLRGSLTCLSPVLELQTHSTILSFYMGDGE